LTSTLDGRQWSVSCPGRFTPSTYWIWGSVRPRASLNTAETAKSLAPVKDRSLAVRPAARLYTYWAYKETCSFSHDNTW
jgi:hypothetical protein